MNVSLFGRECVISFCARLIVCGCVLTLGADVARGQSPQDVRSLLETTVGDLELLRVPATDAELPHPPGEEFRITEPKRRLGQMLYFDPVRTNNIRPEFGGVRAMAQTSSCASCHHSLAASKAGQVSALGLGGEGFGYLDPLTGSFVGNRQAQRGLEDLLPTPMEAIDPQGNVTISGLFDAVDIPGRSAPSMIGFAFNQRLLLGGIAGEPYDPDNPNVANVNPKNLPAAENILDITNGAHRMIETQRFALQQIPVYTKLFAEAFPAEAVHYENSGNPDDVINDETIGRAMATFLRTVITRDSPWDRFLDGDDNALTQRQLRGAELYFTMPELGGAGCVLCHSGPALNKTIGDETGELIEANFHNIGLGDHVMFQLARETFENDDIHDIGRAEATGEPEHIHRFKAPTLRQLADAGPYMHTGQFATLREVLDYFNAGIADDNRVAEHGNVSPQFTNPRGDGTQGLGLSEQDLDALEDFLLNGLYDLAFVFYDPRSPTRTMDPNAADLNYTPEEESLGAVDGLLPSKMFFPNTDARSVAERAAIFGPQGRTDEPPPPTAPSCAVPGVLTMLLTFSGLRSLRGGRRRSG